MATPTTRQDAEAVAGPTPTPTPTAFDRSRYSIDDPRSPWVVVDKRRPLAPVQYEPPDLTAPSVRHTNAPLLRRTAAVALEQMFAAAAAQRVLLVATSTYRSYALQARILASDTSAGGAAYANSVDMRPGYSEHQTGWAVDIGSSTNPSLDFDTRLAATTEGRWLALHAWEHGFHLSYPSGDEATTGIKFEPWHFRYVGQALASELHRTGVRTLQQFFSLKPSPTYPIGG